MAQFDKIFLKIVTELSGKNVNFDMKNPTSGAMETQLFKIEDEVRVAAVHCLVELVKKFDKHLTKKYLKYLCADKNTDHGIPSLLDGQSVVNIGAADLILAFTERISTLGLTKDPEVIKCLSVLAYFHPRGKHNAARWDIDFNNSTKSLEMSEVIIQYIAGWGEVLSLMSIENFADSKNVVIQPIKDLLCVLDDVQQEHVDVLVTNNWRVREKIYSLICKLMINYGQRHEKWKGYEAAFGILMEYYACGFKDSAVKVREMMIQSISQVLANSPMAAVKFHAQIKDAVLGKSRLKGFLVPTHQKTLAMLYINREMIKYVGERGQASETELYSEKFVEAVSSDVPNIQFVAFKCLAECGRYISGANKDKLKNKGNSLLQKKNEIDPDVAAFCAAYMKSSN